MTCCYKTLLSCRAAGTFGPAVSARECRLVAYASFLHASSLGLVNSFSSAFQVSFACKSHIWMNFYRTNTPSSGTVCPWAAAGTLCRWRCLRWAMWAVSPIGVSTVSPTGWPGAPVLFRGVLTSAATWRQVSFHDIPWWTTALHGFRPGGNGGTKTISRSPARSSTSTGNRTARRTMWASWNTATEAMCIPSKAIPAGICASKTCTPWASMISMGMGCMPLHRTQDKLPGRTTKISPAGQKGVAKQNADNRSS